MLTIVSSESQPQFTVPLLTSLYMPTLKERLIHAMGERFSKAQLAKECDISRAAVAKWFNERTKKIEAEYVFKLARLMNVDPEWLATGLGKPERGVAQTRADIKEIPSHRLELIRRYGNLPQELRFPIRQLIETLSAAVSENYAKWSMEMQEKAKERDQIKPKSKKPSIDMT